MTRRLRVTGIDMTIRLAWDDGTDITPIDKALAGTFTTATIGPAVASMAADVAAVEADLLAAEGAEVPTPNRAVRRAKGKAQPDS